MTTHILVSSTWIPTPLLVFDGIVTMKELAMLFAKIKYADTVFGV